MKAIVLAAGYATRLFPYTENYPKSLLNIAGKPLIDYTMDRILASRAIETVYVVTNSRFHQPFTSWSLRYREARAAAGEDLAVLQIVNDGTSSNEERLGSIGDLEFTLRTEGIDDDLLVICSDKMFDFSLVEFINYFRSRGEAVNTCSDTHDPETIKGRFGCLLLGEDNRVIDFQEKPQKPKSSVKSFAFYIYPRKIIPLVKEYLDTGGNYDAPGYFTEWLCKRTPMYGWNIDGVCDDVGSPASYIAANRKYLAAEKGPFREVKVLVLVQDILDSELLTQVVRKLERWDRVTLVYLDAGRHGLAELQRWLAENPPLLPVSLIENPDRGSAGILAERYDCSVTIFLDRDTGPESFDLTFDGSAINWQSEIGRLLDSGSKVVIREGRIQRQAT